MKYFLVVRTILSESVGVVIMTTDSENARELVANSLKEKSGMYSTFEITERDYKRYLTHNQPMTENKVIYAFCSSLSNPFIQPIRI